jgi:outer membrane receptor protein involved in Fe transport
VSIVLSVALAPAAAHAASVRGAVTGGNPRAPLMGVEIVLRRAADSTVVAHASTGEDGRFRLDSLVTEPYLLRASLLGYTPYVRSDVAPTGDAPDLDLGTIALTVSPIAVKGVDVTTARSTTIIAPDRNVYLTKDLPSATTGTATDVLKAVPELDVDINGRVSLRGSTSVTIQLNGRAPPFRGDDLAAYLRQMPGSRIERVEVIANPSAKFDPEGTAGIVNLVLKHDVNMGLSGSVNLAAGQRYSSTGTRVAWQRGPLTMSGGVYGSLYDYRYGSTTQRVSFLTSPPGSVLSDAAYRSEGRNCQCDASVDYEMTKRATLYGTANGFLGASETHGLTVYTSTDPNAPEMSHYGRADDGDYGNQAPSFTLGFQHVVQGGRDERSIEYLQSETHGDNENRGLTTTAIPAGIADQDSRQRGAYGYQERSLQIDDTHPLGARGKLEVGYRGLERLTSSSSALRWVADTAAATPPGDVTDYADRERVHSAYVTLGSTLGRLSCQGGARAEVAATRFDSRSTGNQYDYDYRSLFPSANLSFDFSKGRVLRATYSKRIERPSANALNPDVLVTDSLNRFVGNPYLGPKYIHSYSLDASWSGARGSLRLSPYLRETVGNWDVITEVDARGAATSTWRNASSVRMMGASLTASLRQTGRLGGTASVGIQREHHDASNLSNGYLRDVSGWSANGNLTYRTSPALDLQMYLRYAPGRALAQGRTSSYVGSNLGAKLKLSEKAWVSVTVNDPFDLAHWSSTTGDATYAQVSRTDNRMQSVSAAFGWIWGGQPPEQKQRRQTGEEPQDSSSPAR